MKDITRVVVVGGGCVGVNILHSLTQRGITDAVLLERTELTAGSTWHAAGLVPLYSFSYTFGRIIARSIELYEAVQESTGQEIGWHKCGQLRLANTAERMDEYLNYLSIAETQGVRAQLLSPEQVYELWPLMAPNSRLLGGVYNPDDGHIAPRTSPRPWPGPRATMGLKSIGILKCWDTSSCKAETGNYAPVRGRFAAST